MALPATDTFGSANLTHLETHNSSWTVVLGQFDCRGSNDLACDVNDDAFAAWNADTFDNDQYCQADFPNLNATDSELIGPAVRCSTSAFTGYVLFLSDANCYLSEYINGTESAIATYANLATDGDGVRLEAEGTTIRVYVDTGTGYPGTADQTETGESGISSGAGGIVAFEQDIPRMSNWEAGNLAAAPAANFKGLTLLGVG